MKTFLLRFAIVIALSFCAFAKAEEDNPFIQLLTILAEINDSTGSFANVDEKLSKIKPADCDVDEISLTKTEVEFMVNVFRLEFTAVRLNFQTKNSPNNSN